MVFIFFELLVDFISPFINWVVCFLVVLVLYVFLILTFCQMFSSPKYFFLFCRLFHLFYIISICYLLFLPPFYRVKDQTRCLLHYWKVPYLLMLSLYSQHISLILCMSPRLHDYPVNNSTHMLYLPILLLLLHILNYNSNNILHAS